MKLVSVVLVGIAIFSNSPRVLHAQDVGVEAAQTAEGATLRGAGAYLKGLGWYNLKTAQGNAINTDTAIKWQREMRRIVAENNELQARKAAGKALKIEDVKRRRLQREQQLRTNPTGDDVASGEALNVLLFDLTDPDFTTEHWLEKQIALPKGMSVKDLAFTFIPTSTSSASSKALGKCVIALSRLNLHDRVPTALSADALESERAAYEKAYDNVRKQVIDGKLKVDSLLAMDKSLEALRAKVQSTVPTERGFRTEATRIVDEMVSATRMFDASTVEYAKEIIVDTQDHDAQTVFELVRFMLKYRLQFASTARNPEGRELYTQLYELMLTQLKELGWNSTAASSDGKDPSLATQGFKPLFNGVDLTNWEEENAGHWKARDGILTYDGKGGNLKTDRDYANFELLVEWKIAPGADSGIYLRGKPQVQIWDNAVGSGGLYNNKKHPNQPTVRADKPVGEWNSFRIKMIDQRVTVSLNGKTVVNNVIMENYPNYNSVIPKSGRIELQHHGSPLMFRNILIRELP